MRELSPQETQKAFEDAGIEVANPEIGIGRHLTFPHSALRIVNIILGGDVNNDDVPTLEYISKVLSTILSVEDEWILFPRYGLICDIYSTKTHNNTASLFFGSSEHEKFAASLCELFDSGKQIYSDPYLISKNAQIWAAWDHHVFSDGFCIHMRDIEQSNRLIVRLNNLGVEFETYFTNA